MKSIFADTFRPDSLHSFFSRAARKNCLRFYHNGAGTVKLVHAAVVSARTGQEPA
ncbi:MAG: hypothetical protein ACE10I_04410 [Candidatus Acidiferrales bacterium]